MLYKKVSYCLLVIALYFLSIGRDYYETSFSGGFDLRNRVVGSRLLVAKKDPYFYKWHEEDSTFFLDIVDDVSNIANRVTVPPSLLYILKDFSFLKHPEIRRIYFYTNYLMFFIILLIFINVSANKISRFYIWTFGAVFLSIFPAWFLHMERGQTYLIYVFLLSLAYFFVKHNNKFISGFILAVNIWIRPTFILFTYPLLIKNLKEKKISKFIKLTINDKFLMIILGMFLVLTTYSFLSPQNYAWKSYFKATNMWSKFQVNGELEKREEKLSIKLPVIVEDKNISYYEYMNRSIQDENFSFQKLAKYSLNLNLKSYQLIILYLLLLLLITYFLRENNGSIETLFIYGFLSYIINEYFIPAPRFHYNSIQWLFPLLLMISYPVKDKRLYLIIFISLLLMLPLAEKIPYNLSIGELMLVISLIYYIKIQNKANIN